MSRIDKLKLLRPASAFVLALGLVALGFMVRVESEPGLLPLLLVLLGAVGLVVTQAKIRSASRCALPRRSSPQSNGPGA